MDWVAEAEKLFYIEKLKFVEIEKQLKKHRTTIAKALKKKDKTRFLAEKERRKQDSEEKHRRRCRERWRKMKSKEKENYWY